MDSDTQFIASRAWGESSGLTAQGNEPDKSLDRLWSVLANIAVLAHSRGLIGQMKRAGSSVNADETANYTRMTEAVEKVVKKRYDGPDLPQQAALWQIDAEGRPMSDASQPDRSPPSWIFHPSARQAGEFSDRAGLRYRLFELVDPPPAGQLGYTSSYSKTGLSVRVFTVPATTRWWAWGIGIVASALFVFGGFLAAKTGGTDGAIRGMLGDTARQYDIVLKLARNCVADQTLFPKLKRRACGFLDDGKGNYVIPAAVTAAAESPGQTTAAAPVPDAAPAAGAAPNAAPAKDVRAFGGTVGETLALIRKCLNVGLAIPAAEQKAPPPDADAAAADEAASCQLIARSAADLVPIKAEASFLDDLIAMVTGAKHVAGTRSILPQLVCALLGIAGLAVALGLGTKGRCMGIWIDKRYRVSLARAQVTLWTVVALAGFATIALYNIGLGAPVAFPAIPASIAAALGIAYASPVISALILNSKGLEGLTTIGGAGRDATDFANRGAFLSATSPILESRTYPSDASIADVFLGEQTSDANDVDISRLQNVILTATLVLGYLAMLIETVLSIPAEDILSGLPHLPEPGAAFAAVLLVSHATYLGTKAYKTSPGSSEAND